MLSQLFKTEESKKHESEDLIAYGMMIVVTTFLQKQDMDLVVRAHQVVEDGYERFLLIIECKTI